MMLSKSKIAILLFSIIIISLTLKLSLVDFSVPPTGDSTSYILNVFSYINGDFSPIPNKNPGWPLLLFPFFNLFESEEFIFYSNIARMISLSISTISILPMYLLARKFFSEKFSLIAAGLFAFEPHLIQNAGLGLSEPLYIMIIILSFYFILQNNYKFTILSFVLAGLLWWTRWSGAVMIIVLTIIFFALYYQKSYKIFVKYGICIVAFLIVVSPILEQRNSFYNDPLYFSMNSNFFTGDFGAHQNDMVNKVSETYSANDYITDNGYTEFFDRFIITGISNFLKQMFKISFPYMIILIPFGILFSFRAFDQNKKYIYANWILLIILSATIIIPLSLIDAKRYLLSFLPFLILFSVIPIQRITEYGFSTFSFSNVRKNGFLVIVMITVVIFSSVFVFQHTIPDKIENDESIKFSKFLLEELDGKIMDTSKALPNFRYVKLNESAVFKTYLNFEHVHPDWHLRIGLAAEPIELEK